MGLHGTRLWGTTLHVAADTKDQTASQVVLAPKHHSPTLAVKEMGRWLRHLAYMGYVKCLRRSALCTSQPWIDLGPSRRLVIR